MIDVFVNVGSSVVMENFHVFGPTFVSIDFYGLDNGLKAILYIIDIIYFFSALSTIYVNIIPVDLKNTLKMNFAQIGSA